MITMQPQRQRHISPAIADAANRLRWLIAWKRDNLIRRQRRKYSTARQRMIDQLGDDYRQTLAVMLDTEEPTP